jgi:hypothetical protein
MLSVFPDGLTLWGDGVDNGMFDPGAVGRGMHTIYYAGTYNFCYYEGSFMVQVGGGYNLNVSALNPSCSTCPDGQISVGGEVSGLWFALDDMNWQMSNVFENLTAGVYIVYARDGLGCTQSYAVTLTACDAPTNVTVTQVNPTSVSLTWNPMLGAMDYAIRYRPITGGTWAYWYGAGASATITGLTPQTRYVIQLQTRCSETFASSWTSSVLVITPAAPLPACANASILAVVPGFSSTYVEWSSVPSATHYHIQYKKVGVSGVWTSITVLAPITSLNIPTEPGVQYQLRMRTRCGTTTLTWSENTYFNTPSARDARATAATDVFTIYPNPARGYFTLEFEASEGTAYVSMFDLAGKLVLTQELITVQGVNEAHVALNDVSAGVYVVRLNTAQGTRSTRLTIE